MTRHHTKAPKPRARKKQQRPGSPLKAIMVLGACLIILAAIFSALQSSQPLPVSTSSTSVQSSTTTYQVSVPKSHNPSNATTLNITFNIINDTAEGGYGYWALGNYTENVNAILGNLGYNAIVTAHGTWRSIKGAPSPITGVKEPINGSGRFTEIYDAIIPGRLNDTLMLSGYVGTFNDGATFPFLLENRSRQTRPAHFNWPLLYFDTSAEYISILNSTTVFTYGNQTYSIVCAGSSGSCKTYWNGAGYFGGEPESTVNALNIVIVPENYS